jgi:hypothetical protein
MNDHSPETGGISFDNIFPHNKGFLARHIFGNDPVQVTFSWKYFFDGRHEVVLPLPNYNLLDVHDLQSLLAGYSHSDEFVELCAERRVTAGILVDVSHLFFLLRRTFYD